jgi:WD40 repeat protein
MDANHSLAVYEWDANKHANTGVCAGRLIASTKCDTNRIFCCAYSPDGRVVTGGEMHLKFHTLDLAAEGRPALIGIPAEYAHRARHGFKESTVLCICFNPEGAAFVGTKGGDVYKFKEEGTRAVKKFPVVHQGPVSEILFSANGNFIVTGGKDGKVKFHNAFMHHQFEISLSKVAEAIVDENYNPVCYAASGSRTPYVRAVCQNAGGTKIAVGISCSEVYEFDVSSPGAYTTEAGRVLLVQGHAASINAKSGAAPTMSGEVRANI